MPLVGGIICTVLVIAFIKCVYEIGKSVQMSKITQDCKKMNCFRDGGTVFHINKIDYDRSGGPDYYPGF